MSPTTSHVIFPRTSEAANALLLLAGGEALNAFESERLTERLRASDAHVRDVQAQHFYLLLLRAGVDDLPEAERLKLYQLLSLDEPGFLAPYLHERLTESIDRTPEQKSSIPLAQCFIAPRPGTQSPWSSKATDILRNTGFTSIERIERGRKMTVEGTSSLVQLADALHDRMTEAVFASSGELASLFTAHHAKPLQHIDVLAHGAAAIEQADRALGLSLAPDEVEYLVREFTRLNRNPTDVELYMFAQANSEHCRHKIFNASWTIDGEPQSHSLFAMIRNTYEVSSENVLSAYRDNAAVIRGSRGARFFADPETHTYRAHDEEIHILCKVETHNHPTAISPFPGAATGAGGEIRDEGATGRGAKPKAGLCGFTVSNLRLPGSPQPWEADGSKPATIASALDIMIDAPLGAAAYNNEFGRPNLCGYFRTFEQEHNGTTFGYHKPIMLAGGLGNIRAEHVEKGAMHPGFALIVLGGPAMLIGLGGGAASSKSESANADLEFASVQRDNAELERRAQEVIDRCWQLGDANPIAFIHDVGAGGLSNAFPELVKDGGCGGTFDLNAIPRAQAGLSPLELWCNEAQERYVLAIAPENIACFKALCERERCPFAVIGHAEREKQLVLKDGSDKPIDLPLQLLFGKPPRMERNVTRTATHPSEGNWWSAIPLDEAVERVLRLPAVASKSFLITIGDRSVGGFTVQDQMVGPWQVPVADCAVTMAAYDSTRGEAMAIGERTPLAITNAAASARMAVGEAITNLAGTAIEKTSDIKLSANWMAAAGEPGEDAKLYDAVRAVGMELCPALGLTIPVGKDSMSMRTRWRDANGSAHAVVSPLSLVVSAFAPVEDVRRTLTPQVHPGNVLLLVDLGEGRNRLGGSALSQVFNLVGGETPDTPEPTVLKTFFREIQALSRADKLCAYHDRSDGGLLVTLIEMAFASKCGLEIAFSKTWRGQTPNNDLALLFNEELGAVLEVRPEDVLSVQETLEATGLKVHNVATVIPDNFIAISEKGDDIYTTTRTELQKIWSETSFHIASRRDNPQCAAEEFALLDDADRPGLSVRAPFDLNERVNAPLLNMKRPRVGILREQGVNGQNEMAAAFDRAEFEAVDVHMSDLLAGRSRLDEFKGLAACGGFSYGDVLGAGSGWAKTILFNEALAEMFAEFFARPDTFSLGVCNGCQMMAQLGALVPGASSWPRFTRNVSARFEARITMVEIERSPSLFFEGMAGAQVPIVVAHGEGHVAQEPDNSHVAMRYIDTYGRTTQQYPLNPSGSANGIAGFTSADGRALIIMPHPERVFLGLQHTWTRALTASPWQRMFDNARKWVG